MSAEATGWVYRHSPFKGAEFQVHLAIADSVNDQHNHELWMSQGSLATKARINRETTSRALSALVRRGFLRLMEQQPTGGANRYRFLFPDQEVVYETRGRVTRDHTTVSAVVTPGVRTDHSTCDERSHRTQEEPEVEPKVGDQGRKREDQLVFDALLLATGVNASQITKSYRGAINNAVKQLQEVGATPDLIRVRAEIYKLKFPGATLTPTALAKHWAGLNGKPPSDNPEAELYSIAERRRE